MTDPLMRYFEQELTFVRRALGQFGQLHPEHAEKLRIHQGQIEDPSLARLLDGVALLNATVEKKLNDQLPELVNGLLGILYPSYIQTVPGVAYLELAQDEISTESSLIPKNSRFAGQAGENSCTFSTVADLITTPFGLEDTQATSAPFNFNRPAGTEQSTAVVQLTFSTGDPDVLFKHLNMKDLDFFVQGFENSADSLVELMLSETQAISLSDTGFEQHVLLPAENLKNRVSDLNFQFLPQNGNQFAGFQLINEFFFFKEKRQFFRLKGFGEACSRIDKSTMVLNLFMRSVPAEFIRLFDNNVFKLNVIPAINLFEQQGEPTSYDQRSLTLPVNADAHSSSNIEVVEVKEVYEITPNGRQPLLPLFRDKYHSRAGQDYWQSARDEQGELRLVISMKPGREPEFNKLYGTELLCSNGKQACAVQGSLDCLENLDLPGDFHPLFPPSAPIPRQQDANAHWQFIALLNCNFASLLHAEDQTEALKRMLQLCSREQVSSAEIQMIRQVTLRSQVSAIRVLGKNMFSPGTEIEVTLDNSTGYMVFSDVLNRFFQQFCSFDRYIQLSVRLYGRDGIAKRYAKVHGSQMTM